MKDYVNIIEDELSYCFELYSESRQYYQLYCQIIKSSDFDKFSKKFPKLTNYLLRSLYTSFMVGFASLLEENKAKNKNDITLANIISKINKNQRLYDKEKEFTTKGNKVLNFGKRNISKINISWNKFNDNNNEIIKKIRRVRNKSLSHHDKKYTINLIYLNDTIKYNDFDKLINEMNELFKIISSELYYKELVFSDLGRFNIKQLEKYLENGGLLDE